MRRSQERPGKFKARWSARLSQDKACSDGRGDKEGRRQLKPGAVMILPKSPFYIFFSKLLVIKIKIIGCMKSSTPITIAGMI